MRADEIARFERDPKKVSREGLIEIILGGDSSQVVKEVCSAYGVKGRENLCLATADFRDFMYMGMTKAKALKLAAAIELGRRMVEGSKRDFENFSSPEAVADYFMAKYKYAQQEHFCAVYLNKKNRLLGFQEISVGDSSSTVVDIQCIFRWAVRYGASGLIVAHNHPTGFPEPSDIDDDLVNTLLRAGEIMGVDLLDSIVLGDGKYYSYCQEHRL